MGCQPVLGSSEDQCTYTTKQELERSDTLEGISQSENVSCSIQKNAMHQQISSLLTVTRQGTVHGACFVRNK